MTLGTVSRRCRQLSIVVPVFNEEEVLPLFWDHLTRALATCSFEWKAVFVDDGSADGTLPALIALGQKDKRAAVVSFSRNFGQQMAITAGLGFASGDAVVVMDVDLQDPPELILQMVADYEQGFDVVYAQRRRREGESLPKRLTAYVFYRLMKLMAGDRFPEDVGEFRLMSAAVYTTINSMQERHRFIRGMVAWVGFQQKALVYDRPERAAGLTKWGWVKMIRFAWSAITSFSAWPVRAGFAASGLCLLLCVGVMLRALYVKYVLQDVVRGWTSLVLLQLFFFGLIFLYLGIIGDYVGRIYEEEKKRPLYVVRLMQNMDVAGSAGSKAPPAGGLGHST